MLDRVFALAQRFARQKVVVGQTPAREAHRENKWRLLHYVPRPEGRRFQAPIVLVPSLINRHYVLDLMPGKSFVEWLVARGHDVYCIDWGTPEDEDRYLTFDEITDRYIGRAIRLACRESGSPRAHVLGYCLGGTLAAIHATVRPEHVGTLTLLATPIGFHDGGMLSRWTRTQAFDVRSVVQGLGNIPWQLMQSAFHMLRPTMTLAKATTMLDKAWDDEFLDGFLALETWGNDNVSFPGACYERYIEELYRNDALIKGTFTLSGQPARLENITCPLLAVTFEHDAIVPWQSGAVVMDAVGSKDKHRLHLQGGHVGAVVSKKAAKGLWPAIATFWEDRDQLIAATPQATPSEASTARTAESIGGCTPSTRSASSTGTQDAPRL